MSIANEIQRIIGAKGTLKEKLVEWGLTTADATATIDALVGLLDDYLKKSSSDLTRDKNKITAPAGFYGEDAEASVPLSAIGVPDITVGTDGKITATVTQTEGYVLGGSESATKQITDNNLKAEYIKSGVTLFGTEGTFTGDANALAAHILKDYIAYVKGAKVVGTMPTYGTQEKTIDPMSDTPYYEQTFSGYVTGVSVTIDPSFEATLAGI